MSVIEYPETHPPSSDFSIVAARVLSLLLLLLETGREALLERTAQLRADLCGDPAHADRIAAILDRAGKA